MRDSYKGYWFVLPAFLLLLVVLGFPTVAAMLQSLNLIWVKHPTFSLASYRALAADPDFLRSLLNTIVFVASVVTFHLLLGLGVALLLNQEIRSRRFFRVIAILPWTMPDPIGGIIWRFMFDTLPGMVNAVLLKSGLISEAIDWLGRPVLAFTSLILAESWRGYPFVMLILLAGMQAIPRQQYEAAELDGASAMQSFLHVTIPNLRGMFIIALVLDTIWECRAFGMVFTMTGGGPGNFTQVLSLMTYRQYFQFFNTSYAAAIAMVLASLMLLISLPYLRMTMKREG